MIKVFHKGHPLGTSTFGFVRVLKEHIGAKSFDFGTFVLKVEIKSDPFQDVIAAWSSVSSPELRCDMKDLFPHVAKSIAALSDTAIAN